MLITICLTFDLQTLGKKEMEQQHHIWELITTEHNHITIISTVINSLLTCLKELHNGLLISILLQTSNFYLILFVVSNVHGKGKFKDLTQSLLTENFLTKINVHDVFLNIERIREVHLAFWNDCIVPLIDTVS